jgi:uncharacterized protein YraI
MAGLSKGWHEMDKKTLIRVLRVATISLVLGAVMFAGTTVALAQDQAAGTVAVNGLNLRAGPGLTYSVLRVLTFGQTVTLVGRSANSLWVESRLPNGSGGWLYSPYVDTDVSLAGLPVTEAAGGPGTGPVGPGNTGSPAPFDCAGYAVCLSINNDLATAYLAGFPANTEVTVKLGSTAQTAEVVAEGATDASGKAQLTFSMPTRWSAGPALTRMDLVMVASTTGPNMTVTVNVQYYPGTGV